MNESDLNGADNKQADVESYLKRFRPVETSASISETFYQAGWRAAVAPQITSAKKSARRGWTTFLSGAACGMLPMLILLMNKQAGIEPGVAGSDLPMASPVQPSDETPRNADVATSSDAKRFEHSAPLVAEMPTAINVFAETFMLSSWFPRLQVSESSMSSNSVLCFRPLTSEVVDFANLDQGWSASSKYLTTTHDAAPSVDQREPLSARSSAFSDELFRELSL